MKILFTEAEIKKLEKCTGFIGQVLIVGKDHHFKYPKLTNRLVYITSGSHIENGRICNHWHWHNINEDGTLGKENYGYGNFYKPKRDYKARIIIS